MSYYLLSRMKVSTATGQVKKACGAIARIALPLLPLFLFLQLIAQPELDGQHPIFGARSLSAQIFKQQHSTKIGLAHSQQLFLAARDRLFAPGYHLLYVRIAGQPVVVRTPFLSLRSIRSPPRIAAA